MEGGMMKRSVQFNFARKIESISFLLRRRIQGQYVVIESDDWGMERAWSEQGIEWATSVFGKEKFSRWTTDALETTDDLTILYDLLDSFRAKFVSPPVITANFITHNIGRKDTGELEFKPISSGFFSDVEDVRPMYHEGIKAGYIVPQYHGFSHFNPGTIEEYNKSKEADDAYARGFFLAKNTIRGDLNLFHGELSDQNALAEVQLRAGLQEFEKFFGFKSMSIIPPTYILDKKILRLLSLLSVRYVQSGNRLKDSNKLPYLCPPLRKRHGIIWGMRNARFDPHPEYNFNHEQCLSSIAKAFKNQLPAVIDFHRVNFSGRYNPEYRKQTISELNLLFSAMCKHWPEVNFISTPQLIRRVYGTS